MTLRWPDNWALAKVAGALDTYPSGVAEVACTNAIVAWAPGANAVSHTNANNERLLAREEGVNMGFAPAQEDALVLIRDSSARQDLKDC